VIATGPEVLFNGGQQGFAASTKSRMLNSRPVPLGPIPGREIEFEMPGGGKTFMRYYLSGNRFYQLAVSGPRMLADSEEVKKVFDSFKVKK
jgi:hypothetical protein